MYFFSPFYFCNRSSKYCSINKLSCQFMRLYTEGKNDEDKNIITKQQNEMIEYKKDIRI